MLFIIHIRCCGCEYSSYDCGTISDNDYNVVSHGIKAEFQQNSNGISWIPLGIIPRGFLIPTISVRTPQKKVGISMEMKTQMAEAPANWFP